MNFLQKIKYAIGIAESDDTDGLISDDPGLDTEPAQPRIVHKYTQPKSETHISMADNNHVENQEAVNAIYKHAVKIFNESLPDFIKNSVDAEKQQKLLYDSLEQGIKDYFDAQTKLIERDGMKRWESEKARLTANLREYESRVREFDNNRSEITQKHLTAERQRKALAERVKNLEESINTLEAEKEQFELENKSLLNKLKVSSVFEKENAEMRAKIDELETELSSATNNRNISPAHLGTNSNEQQKLQNANAELQTQVDQLRASVSELKSQIELHQRLNEKKDARIAGLTQQLETANINPRGENSHQLSSEDNKAEIERLIRIATEPLIRENEQLKRRLASTKDESSRGRRQPRLIQPNATPIEDILGDTEWAVTVHRKGEIENSPKKRHEWRKNRNGSTGPDKEDSQLSLF